MHESAERRAGRREERRQTNENPSIECTAACTINRNGRVESGRTIEAKGTNQKIQ